MTAAVVIKSLFGNNIFQSTASSFCIAQILKTVVFLLTQRQRNIRKTIEMAIWRTGGMPSSHSAVVCSLTTAVGIREGVSSNLFVFCLIFAMVVLRDALGVRRAAGLQAKALNNLGKQTADKVGMEFHAVKEIQGHTPLEVTVGAFLGIFISAVFYIL
ncbi:MAG: divergent PAP2 family protein [Treponema sp.]|jgi:acid phosphatase family membrane protein YuiD|nr:divergent PAP2 family protein [Treponema sp.]